MMAAAYAALISVNHILDQLRLHPRPPISIHTQHAQSLTRIISSLLNFLEGYTPRVDHSDEADELECRIADAAHAAEDVIEGYIVDRILARSESSSDGEEISCIEFGRNLERVIGEMDLIEKEAMLVKEKGGNQGQLRRLSSVPAGSGRDVAMIGVDEILVKLMDTLISDKSGRQTISITGMGGIGKTTLARSIYENQIVEHHFDILAWVTVSQEYTMEDLLLQLFLCLRKSQGMSRESLSEMSEDELGEILYKSLCGMRYLIVIDDLWDVEVWDGLQHFFPNDRNQSRIMITTRLANLALRLSGSHSYEMNFLDEKDSWSLLCKYVFGKESCPLELEDTGRKIARNCKGLPLFIITIGGLLAASERTLGYWKHIARDLISTVNLEADERCLKILYTSYNQLPVHLKPCFLYMGVFPEDRVVIASELIKLWVAEGFLRSIDGKSLDEVAKEYLKELVDRNLILVHKWGSGGKIKSCKIHDLLRDLCLREADKQKFAGFVRPGNPDARIPQCRILVHRRHRSKELYHSDGSHMSPYKLSYAVDLRSDHYYDTYLYRFLAASKYVSPARSLIWDSFGDHSYDTSSKRNLEGYFEGLSESPNGRLLRVFKIFDLRHRYSSSSDDRKSAYFQDSASKLVNLRYISYPQTGYSFSPSVCRLWNLYTLTARHTTAVAPPEIWKMPLLRHVEFYSISLPDPPIDGFVLGSLQTLCTVTIWDCRKKVLKSIPNIKKLKIHQGKLESWSVIYLKNLACLHKLESLEITIFGGFFQNSIPLEFWSNLALPHSLKKLTLYGTRIRWEEMPATIGWLPHLQVLKLKRDSFVGSEWETVERQFCKLKYLQIAGCDLVYWTTESAHFPCLEHLQLEHLILKEIPLAIGEIPTLQSIKLVDCSTSAVASATKIREDQQENYGNDDLQVQIERSIGRTSKDDLQVLPQWNQVSDVRKIEWSKDIEWVRVY
ncbi:putative late blight resistance protein homolog R1A-10 isoform X1 [Salvia hispanica]|uniref:putative late blight resistance protein homolog R1A-10 isoform X1 n=1 Tax=Salvia hispanica TaxID=49212 RepID=UPI0020093ECA|nr:putative late blight resistance protein homolog R1A-10 isoform X1 [Salvia hispanica]